MCIRNHLMKKTARAALLVFLLFFPASMSLADESPAPPDGETGCFPLLENLSSKAADAYRRGDYAKGAAFAEKAHDHAVGCLGKTHPATLESMNNLAALYDVQGRYEKAEPLYREALALYEKMFGTDDPATLTFVNNLASLYDSRGLYDKAGPLYQKALENRERILGPGHPDTLASMNGLAGLRHSRGEYEKARSLYERALALREKFLGPEHPDTLASMNVLAGANYALGRYEHAEALYKKAIETRKKIMGKENPDSATFMNRAAASQGFETRYADAHPLPGEPWETRGKILKKEDIHTISSMHNLAFLHQGRGDYEKAEPLYQEALRLREKNLGPDHPDTLASMDSLAGLLFSRDRHREAEPLYKRAMDIRKEKFGDAHPATLASMNNLAFLYQTLGLYHKAEPLYQEELRIREKIFEKDHPDTLASMNVLAFLHQIQGRLEEAEILYADALSSYRRALGEKHPDTLAAINNLAAIYYSQGRYDEAEPLYKEALELREEIYEKDNPETLLFRLNYILLTLNMNKTRAAFELLKQTEARLISASADRLGKLSGNRDTKLFLYALSNFQDVALSLAVKFPQREYKDYAAGVIFRWKQAYAREQAAAGRLFYLENQDSYQEKTRLAREFADAFHDPESGPAGTKRAGDRLAEAIGRLKAKTRDFVSPPASLEGDLRQALARLPGKSAILEFRQARHIDFETGKPGKLYFAACLLSASPTSRGADFAYIGESEDIIQTLMESGGRTENLWGTLMGPFENRLKDIDTLFVAPDGFLTLIPFSSLRTPDGEYLARRFRLSRLLSGRDIMESRRPWGSSDALSIFGAPDYGPFEPDPASASGPAPLNSRIAGEFRQGLEPLALGKREAGKIAMFYADIAGGGYGRTLLKIGRQASESDLKNMETPPRAIHFSTRCFYLPGISENDLKNASYDEASLSSAGLALSGANRGIQGVLDASGEDGLLYDMEISRLNLVGTELASVSSCLPGENAMDYSQGVYELARAFKTAGAASVLIPIRPVGDEMSKEFMTKFYEIWITSPEDIPPAEALSRTRRYFMNHSDEKYRAPGMWSPYVVIDGHIPSRGAMGR
ncbi:putative CHAT domain-containing protein [Candidatus Desulfarcum epimagneticum]|uniref:Putative CHAT domain-containing protein n=1 Tax=uncultured Desulfobacteraceae bacterium TaxID=218296 RepID=A0A484HEX9_9BACT|nr:putative CHAT domain-containing protein [uncultured Desulfobacteraceae bacterium]